jgi:hypothetical protein
MAAGDVSWMPIGRIGVLEVDGETAAATALAKGLPPPDIARPAVSTPRSIAPMVSNTSREQSRRAVGGGMGGGMGIGQGNDDDGGGVGGTTDALYSLELQFELISAKLSALSQSGPVASLAAPQEVSGERSGESQWEGEEVYARSVFSSSNTSTPSSPMTVTESAAPGPAPAPGPTPALAPAPAPADAAPPFGAVPQSVQQAQRAAVSARLGRGFDAQEFENFPSGSASSTPCSSTPRVTPSAHDKAVKELVGRELAEVNVYISKLKSMLSSVAEEVSRLEGGRERGRGQADDDDGRAPFPTGYTRTRSSSAGSGTDHPAPAPAPARPRCSSAGSDPTQQGSSGSSLSKPIPTAAKGYSPTAAKGYPRFDSYLGDIPELPEEHSPSVFPEEHSSSGSTLASAVPSQSATPVRPGGGAEGRDSLSPLGRSPVAARDRLPPISLQSFDPGDQTAADEEEEESVD